MALYTKKTKVWTDATSDNNNLTIDINTLEKDNKSLRATMLKSRFANVIKSQKQVLGDAFDAEEMKKKASLWDKQLQQEKANLKREREKVRRVARIAIQSMKRTLTFDDDIQAEKDFYAMIGAKRPW